MVASEQMARKQHRYVGSFIACGVGVGVVLAWVLLAKPADGWFSFPVALVGVPCAIGVVVLGLLLVANYYVRLSEAHRASRMDTREAGVPTVIVELSDGSAPHVLSLGHLERLSRIEALLRMRMDDHHVA